MDTKKNLSCPCKREKCSRHGNCEACREHHFNVKGKPAVACERVPRERARKERRIKRGKEEKL